MGAQIVGDACFVTWLGRRTIPRQDQVVTTQGQAVVKCLENHCDGQGSYRLKGHNMVCGIMAFIAIIITTTIITPSRQE
eukprot:scaffold2907_cov161-Amphora_coffeaeformis.AAC.9